MYKYYLHISIVHFAIGLALLLLIDCSHSNNYWEYSKCVRQAMIDFDASNKPIGMKKIELVSTPRGLHTQTLVLDNGRWIPYNLRWYISPDHVFNTYFDIDSFQKSGWVRRGAN